MFSTINPFHRCCYQTLRVTRSFSTSNITKKKVPDDLKGRSKSSQDWLTRQLNDPYVRKAKMENYRARSAFKLLEIDDSHRLLRPGQTVVECGAAPGAWTQVSIKRINANISEANLPVGKHIAVDLLPMHPLEGATLLTPADFTSPETQKNILSILNGDLVDIVLSDMAPRASGVRSLDQEAILDLALQAFNFARSVSKHGGDFLVKVWSGGGVPKFQKDLQQFYQSVKIIKPASSRQDSAEIFILAKSFKGS